MLRLLRVSASRLRCILGGWLLIADLDVPREPVAELEQCARHTHQPQHYGASQREHLIDGCGRS